MATGLALQAVGLGLDRRGLDADRRLRVARRAVHRLRHRHGAVLRAGRQRRPLGRAAGGGGQGLRREQRDPRGRRRARRRGAGVDLRAQRRLRVAAGVLDGIVPALWVGAAVLAAGLARLAADPAKASSGRRACASTSASSSRNSRPRSSSNEEGGDSVKLSTQTITTASARHPWRTIGAWIVVVRARDRGDRDAPRRQPDDRGRADEQPRVGARDRRARSRRSRRIPDDVRRRDVVVIRSDAVHGRRAGSSRRSSGVFVDDDEIAALTADATYLDEPSDAAVSEDRHATHRPDRAPRRRRDGGGRREGRGARARSPPSPSRSTGDGDARPRLQPPLAGGPGEGRAPVRAAGRADRPAARLRRGRRRARPAAAGDRLDRRRARARRRSSGRRSSSRSSS